MPSTESVLVNHGQLSRESAREFVRHSNALLGAVSRSMEQFSFDYEKEGADEIQEAYLDIQKTIFRFKAVSGRLKTRSDFDAAVENTFGDLDEFLTNSRGYLLRSLKVKIPLYRIRAPEVFLHPGLHESRVVDGLTALTLLRDSLNAARKNTPYVVNYSNVDSKNEDVESVIKKIPAQKIAPAQFDVQDGKLRVVSQSALAKSGSDDLIAQSLDALLDQGRSILEQLRNGNYDVRVCKHFEKLQDSLESGQNIVKLGLENITAKAMAVAFSGELADAILAQIEGYSTGIAMYVSQFEEWQIFVQNAAEASIEDGAEKTLTAFLGDLHHEFEQYSDVIDPEVPKTILFLTELISDPQRASKRAIFAFLRTIENLISKSFSFVFETISKTADKTSDKLSDSASKMIVRALVGIGLISAAGMLPVTSGVSGMEWIEAAYKVVSEQVAPKLGIF